MRSGCVLLCAVASAWMCLALAAIGEDISNLATNPSFESIEQEAWGPVFGWGVFASKNPSVSLADDIARTGEHCVRVSAQGVAFAHLGIMQELTIDPSKQYEVSAYVRSDRKDPLGLSAFGMIGMEWLDEEGKEIRRMTSLKWDRNLSRMRWRRYNVKAEAPHDAVKARFVIYLYDGDKAAKGACLIDDVEITAK